MDRVRPLKFESAETGGTEEDAFPTALDHNEDYVDVRGITIQNNSSNDETVYISRDASNNLVFKDPSNNESTLTEVLAGTGALTESAHKTLRQLIHFIDNGPAEGFTSGAYREITGTVFPTSIVWYTDSTKTDKIVEKNITWTGINPTTIEWKIYDTDGSSVLATVSDSISYSTVFETNRTRTITVA